MCWNADISINTFLFSCLALFFIYFTNTFTKYKSQGFDNPFMYLIIFSFVSMQLVEYFLWQNLKNKEINMNLSIIGFVIIFIQPITLMLYDSYDSSNVIGFIQNFALYTVGFIGFLLYKYFYNPILFTTTIGVNKHLKWNWLYFTTYELIVYILLYFSYFTYSFFFLSKNINDIFKYVFVITALISKMLYSNTSEFGSMWCWVINSYLLILVVNILIIKPFYEYNGLC